MLALQRRGIVDTYSKFTLTRSSMAYDSCGKLYHPHNARFEQGKFDRAVIVEERTTNLFPDALSRSFDDPWTSGVLNGTYTVSVRGGTGSLVLSGGATGTVSAGSSLTFTVSNASVTFTPIGGIPQMCQLEAKNYATSWTLGGGVRTTETLTIPTTGIMNPNEGTIEIWIKPLVVANYNNFFDMVISTGRFLLFFDNTGRIYWDFGPINDSIFMNAGLAVAGQWLHVAMRWSASGGTRDLFVNGQKKGSKSFNPPVSFPTTVSVVNSYSASIDDLRISNIARSDTEISNVYNSSQPITADANTTLLLNFDGPDAQRAAKTLVL